MKEDKATEFDVIHESDGRIRQRKREIPSASDQAEREMEALLAWLKNAQCTRNDKLRLVLNRSPSVLEAGTSLYRLHWQRRIEDVHEDIRRRPNYFATNWEAAAEYGRGVPPINLLPFCVKATAKRRLHLADVVAFELVKAVNFGVESAAGARVGPFPALAADPRFRGDSIGIQRWLVWEAACKSKAYDNFELDGVWDNDGADVLIANATAVLDLAIRPRNLARPGTDG